MSKYPKNPLKRTSVWDCPFYRLFHSFRSQDKHRRVCVLNAFMVFISYGSLTQPVRIQHNYTIGSRLQYDKVPKLQNSTIFVPGFHWSLLRVSVLLKLHASDPFPTNRGSRVANWAPPLHATAAQKETATTPKLQKKRNTIAVSNPGGLPFARDRLLCFLLQTHPPFLVYKLPHCLWQPIVSQASTHESHRFAVSAPCGLVSEAIKSTDEIPCNLGVPRFAFSRLRTFTLRYTISGCLSRFSRLYNTELPQKLPLSLNRFRLPNPSDSSNLL